jgi:ornithine carbamoyltransferase
MEERTALIETGDKKKLDDLEKRCLQNNARFQNWQCTETLMEKTSDALYLHCLPADITGVSCERGEVEASVFDRFRTPLYRQAGWKPYIIAAMIFTSRMPDPRKTLSALLDRAQSRLI